MMYIQPSAIFSHRRLVDGRAKPGLVAFAVGDQVAAILDEEIRPFLEPVVVDAVGIGGDQLMDAEPHRIVIHRCDALFSLSLRGATATKQSRCAALKRHEIASL